MKIRRLATPWRNLENETYFYWELLQQMPEQKLKAKPLPDKWSILEVIEHLIGAEEAGLQYMLRKQYTPLQSRSFLPAGIRSVLLTLALRSPLKFKVPKQIENIPTNSSKPEALLQHWKDMRGQFKDYLEKVPPNAEDQPLFRHPRAGPLTLSQTIGFMAEHLHHHQRQVNQLLAQKPL